MVFTSPYPDVEIPETSLPAYTLEHAARYGDKPALIDGPSGRTITYSELATSVRRLAAGLAARGFGADDVFAIYAPNVPEYAVAFHGVLSAGGIVTTVNPSYTAHELAFQLTDSGARFLLTIPQFVESALEAAGQTAVEEVFVLGEAVAGTTAFAELLAGDADPPAVERNPEDLAVLPYSSGTTGLPKGVMLTHRNLAANIAQCRPVFEVTESDVVLGVLPFFHIYGMTVIMNIGLRVGLTIVTMPRFDLKQFLGLIAEHTVTRVNVVPPIVLALAKQPVVDDYDLSSLRLLFSGAAPLGGELAEECAQRLGCMVSQGYGLTETSPVTHANPEDPQTSKPSTAGRLLPNQEARLVDPETGEDRGVGETGELWLRGPNIMRGYLNNPGATEAMLDEEGWLRTGDIATIDEDGFYSIVDRLKELIKYKGFQVAPAELEAVLLSHHAVGDAAVIGVPDAEAGEVPKGFVVLRGEATPDELMAHVAQQVARYKQLHRLEIVDEIPKSASGKILRRVLMDAERERAEAQ